MPPASSKRRHLNRRGDSVRGSNQDKQEAPKSHGKENLEIRKSASHEDVPKCEVQKIKREENDVQVGAISEESDFLVKKYSKRAVNKNWSKYEEKSEVMDESIGMDYQVALRCSSSAASQLKLEEEKGWDEEFLKIDSNDFTSINCDDLMHALGCIPFHEQLGISKEFFMTSMIDEFNNEAEFQRKTYVSSKTSRAISKQTKLKNNLNGYKETDVKNIIESLSNCFSLKNEVDGDEIKDVSLNTNNDDETLEMLLLLSEKKNDDITEKLNLSVYTESPKLKSKKVESIPEISTNSLDDWLDSIVED